jgi:RHS repeat-associated protein
MRSSYNGAVEATFTSLPWGDAQTTASGTDLDAYHYATLDYDPETATDHAQFRQDSSAQGHFMSPDPYAGSYDMGNPQSMNRYAYVMNNPLAYIDPLGLQCSGGYTIVVGAYEVGGWDPVACSGGEGWGGGDGSNGSAYRLQPLMPMRASVGGGGRGPSGVPASVNVSGSAPNNGNKNPFLCGSEAAGKISAAAALHNIPGLGSGVGGFIADAVGGNAFSGATDLAGGWPRSDHPKRMGWPMSRF